MLISEFIRELKRLKKEHGDKHIVIYYEFHEPHDFHFAYIREINVIYDTRYDEYDIINEKECIDV